MDTKYLSGEVINFRITEPELLLSFHIQNNFNFFMQKLSEQRGFFFNFLFYW